MAILRGEAIQGAGTVKGRAIGMATQATEAWQSSEGRRRRDAALAKCLASHASEAWQSSEGSRKASCWNQRFSHRCCYNGERGMAIPRGGHAGTAEKATEGSGGLLYRLTFIKQG